MKLRRTLEREDHADTLLSAPEVTAALLEHLADGVIACDASGATLLFNRKAREIFGVPRERVLPHECAEYYELFAPGEDRLLAIEEIPLVRARGGEHVRDVVVEVRRKGRSPLLVNVSGDPITGRRRRLLGAVVVVQDITARAAMEQSLRLQGAIAEQMAASVVVLKAVDGEIVQINDAAVRMFGYRRQELIGQPMSLLDVSTSPAPAERARSVVAALERDHVWTGEIEHTSKRGERFWCAVSITPFEHPSHGTVWISVHTDITGRKAAEETVNAAADRFRLLFEQSPVGILVMADDLRLLEVNRTVCDITGYRRDELVGKTLADITHPDDAARETEVVRRVIEGQLSHYEGQQRYITKDGGVVRVDHLATAIRDPAGSAISGLAIIRPLEDGGSEERRQLG